MSRTILITGASSGFGRTTAEALTRLGHRVFASMRDPNTKNRDHAQELHRQGIIVVELDVTSDTSVDHAVEKVLDSVRSFQAAQLAQFGGGEGVGIVHSRMQFIARNEKAR